MEDFYVEVLNSKGVWHRATLIDIDSQGLLVKFDAKNSTPVRVSYADTRIPSSPLSANNLHHHLHHNLKPGDDCEVLPESLNDDDPSGWWPATIKQMKGDFYVVNYKVQDETKHNEIVSSDRIRVPNRNPPLQPHSLFKTTLAVPDDLREIYRHENPSREFRKACNVLSVYYDEQANTLSVICDQESGIKRANILSESHFKGLRQKAQLVKRTQEIAQQLEKSRLHAMSAKYSDEFYVPKELMGLAIGSHGSNIQEARKIRGINSIELDEQTYKFRILGESESALREARNMLEFAEDTVHVPREYIGKMIGKNGSNIQDILDKSGVVRVKIEDSSNAASDASDASSPQVHGHGHGHGGNSMMSLSPSVSFVFVGTVDSINNAKLLIDFQVSQLRELDALRKEKVQMDEQLKSLISSTSSGLNNTVNNSISTNYYKERGNMGNGQLNGGGYRGGSESRYDDRYNQNNNNGDYNQYGRGGGGGNNNSMRGGQRGNGGGGRGGARASGGPGGAKFNNNNNRGGGSQNVRASSETANPPYNHNNNNHNNYIHNDQEAEYDDSPSELDDRQNGNRGNNNRYRNTRNGGGKSGGTGNNNNSNGGAVKSNDQGAPTTKNPKSSNRRSYNNANGTTTTNGGVNNNNSDHNIAANNTNGNGGSSGKLKVQQQQQQQQRPPVPQNQNKMNGNSSHDNKNNKSASNENVSSQNPPAQNNNNNNNNSGGVKEQRQGGKRFGKRPPVHQNAEQNKPVSGGGAAAAATPVSAVVEQTA